MSSEWTWIVLGLIVQWAVMIFRHKNLCRGWITRYVLSRIPPRIFWELPQGGLTRICVWFFVAIGIEPFLSDRTFTAIYWGGFIILYLDDWVFGDDDGPRKRWERAKNKIKWRLKQPVPIRVKP